MAYTKFKPLTNVFVFKSRLNIDDIDKETSKLFAGDEKIIVGARNGNNLAVFTNKRLLLLDAVTLELGTNTVSVPYTSITTFSFRTFKSHSSLRLTLNNSFPVKIRFIKDYDNITIKEIYSTIGSYK